MKHISHSITETLDLASNFSKQLKGGEVIALIGDLGAGKTHFVKGMAAALGINSDEVSSPTFSLMQIYEASKPLVHLDLYRLENFAQVQELGFEDSLQNNAIVVIEWADKFFQDLTFDWRVEIRKVDLNTREIEICNSLSLRRRGLG